jgi:hypothetical protein
VSILGLTAGPLLHTARVDLQLPLQERGSVDLEWRMEVLGQAPEHLATDKIAPLPDDDVEVSVEVGPLSRGPRLPHVLVDGRSQRRRHHGHAVTVKVDQVCRPHGLDLPSSQTVSCGTDDDDVVDDDDDDDKDDEEYDKFSLFARSAGGTIGTL